MNNKYLIKDIKNWVNQIHPQAKHLIRTGYWAKKIDIKVSQEIMVACLTHDIEQAFPIGGTPPGEFGKKWLSGQAWDNKDYLIWHRKRSADFV